MTGKTQAEIIAEIATTLSDKPQPTAVEILMGLNRALEAGIQIGLSFPTKPIEGFDEQS
jgi:hypothetical protein